MIYATRAQRRQLERENAKLPVKLQELPRHEWPDPTSRQLSVWRSRDYLVQVFPGDGAPVTARLSINRTTLTGNRWDDNIPWDELQRLKAECGFGSSDAVEVYPADKDVVNVANMRHLWVLHEPLPFAWRDRESPAPASHVITDRAEIERTFAADADAEEAAQR